MDALFIRSADGTLVPTELARGPWSPDALHGGPVAAVLIRGLEREVGDAERVLARVTIDLLRPAPLAPMTVEASTLREGRKVVTLEAVLSAGGRQIARAGAVAVRALPTSMRSVTPPHFDDTESPIEAPRGAGGWVGFHNSAVEMRFVSGAFASRGPATVWMRLRVPVVRGEEASPVMRAGALADFGNGISSELDFTTWQFLNADLSMHVARAPRGEWICLDARTVLGDRGAALAESALSDRDGVFGRSVQSLILDPR